MRWMIGSIFCALMALCALIAAIGVLVEGHSPIFQIITVAVFALLAVVLLRKQAKQQPSTTKPEGEKAQPEDVYPRGTVDASPAFDEQASTPRAKYKVSGCLTLLIVIAVIIAVIVMVVANPSGSKSDLGDISTTIEVSREKADQISEVLKQCGIEATDITHDELLDNAHQESETGYRIETEETDDAILYLTGDGLVYSIKWGGYDLYKDGQILAKLSDYMLSTLEKSNIQYTCQEQIKSILKSPATANFPNILEWTIQKENGVIIVQSYVDSQNSFGANMRSQFQFTIQQDGTVSSFIFDGKELMAQ